MSNVPVTSTASLLLTTAPTWALMGDCDTRGQCRLGEGPVHSPVQLGVFYQCVGVPITDEGPTHEADEAFRVVLQLPGHLAGRWVGQPSLAAPSSPISPPLGLLSEWQPQTRGPDWPVAEISDRAGSKDRGLRDIDRQMGQEGMRKLENQ